MPSDDPARPELCNIRQDPSLVSSIMTRRVIAVSMDDTVSTVRHLFERHRFHHVVVVDKGRAVGVVSDRDLLHHISPFVGQGAERPLDRATLDRKVHQVMTRKLVWVKEDVFIEEAGQLMLHHTISCLPVLDEAGACVGILTTHDVLRWCLQGKCKVDYGGKAA
jgi:acetoin utilization protein AcuB